MGHFETAHNTPTFFSQKGSYHCSSNVDQGGDGRGQHLTCTTKDQIITYMFVKLWTFLYI